MTRDPLILLALREREAQPSHKINYVNEWILALQRNLAYERASMHHSILHKIEDKASSIAEDRKKMFKKVDHQQFECRVSRGILKNTP